MSELHVWVMIYSLSCDDPKHIKLDPNAPDYDVRDRTKGGGGTIKECRAEARQIGWLIRRDGSSICPDCQGKTRGEWSRIKGGGNV